MTLWTSSRRASRKKSRRDPLALPTHDLSATRLAEKEHASSIPCSTMPKMRQADADRSLSNIEARVAAEQLLVWRLPLERKRWAAPPTIV